MKKLLPICVAMVCAMTMYAETVELVFNTSEGLEALQITPAVVEDGATQGKGVEITTVTLGNVELTANQGTGSTAPNVWTNKDEARTTEFRVYKGNTLVLTGKEETDLITYVEITGTSIKFDELTDKKWYGSSHSITLTATDDGTRSIKKIIVTLNEPKEKPYEPDTLNVAEAIELIKANDPLAAKTHYVKGIVASDPFMLGSTPAFNLKDINNPSDVAEEMLQGYKIGKTASAQYKDADEMAAAFGMGDTILIYANALKKYNAIYEADGGYFVKVIGSPAIIPDWQGMKGVALRKDGQWELRISDTGSDDYIDLAFSNSREDAIAGSYNLVPGSQVVYHGEQEEITSGTLKFTFKKIEVDDNWYMVQATASVDDGKHVYRISKELRIFAWDGEFPILLAADRPYVPAEGDLLTCAQAREYALSLGSGKSGVSVSVIGYITDVFADQASFWIDDNKGSAKTFEIFKFSSLSPAGTTLVKGLKVKATGTVSNYNGTPEISNGSVEIINEDAVENIRTGAPAVKMIEDGQLIILRNGIRYNVHGQVVK